MNTKDPADDPAGREHSERPGPNAPQLPPIAPVALRMEGLLTWVAQRVAKFPRDVKFTVGDRWLESCIDVETSLLEAAGTFVARLGAVGDVLRGGKGVVPAAATQNASLLLRVVVPSFRPLPYVPPHVLQ